MTTIKSAWQAVKRELKIDYGCTTRDTRWLPPWLWQAYPDAKRQYLMGNVDENVIRRYTHLQAEDCRADLEKALATRRNPSGVPTVSPTAKKQTKEGPIQ